MATRIHNRLDMQHWIIYFFSLNKLDVGWHLAIQRGYGVRVAFSKKICRSVVSIWLLFPAIPLWAQQNLFNIPSGDVTPKGKVFYQHQLNFYSVNEFESKSHLVLGFGKGWDAGLNLVDVPFQMDANPVLSFNDNSNRKPLYPLLMFTLQKQFQLSQHSKLNIGTQAGPNISMYRQNKRIAFFNYILLKTKIARRANIVFGTYHTDNTFVGKDKHHIGFLAGYEILLTKRWSLMGDWISGNHKKAQSTIGAFYTIGKRTQLCGAALFDYPHGQPNHGVIFELNVFGWDIESHHHKTTK